MQATTVPLHAPAPCPQVSALCNRRYTETTIGYAESHDQALVGDQVGPGDVCRVRVEGRDWHGGVRLL